MKRHLIQIYPLNVALNMFLRQFYHVHDPRTLDNYYHLYQIIIYVSPRAKNINSQSKITCVAAYTPYSHSQYNK